MDVVNVSPMDINDEDEDVPSDTDTWPYHDQDIDLSGWLPSKKKRSSLSLIYRCVNHR